jgi:hypothetical protein
MKEPWPGRSARNRYTPLGRRKMYWPKHLWGSSLDGAFLFGAVARNGSGYAPCPMNGAMPAALQFISNESGIWAIMVNDRFFKEGGQLRQPAPVASELPRALACLDG